MAKHSIPEVAEKVNPEVNPTYEWNGQRWVAEIDLSRPYHYILRNPDTEQRLPFPTEEKRQAFVDCWLAVDAAVDALVFAVNDSIAVKARALEIAINYNAEGK